MSGINVHDFREYILAPALDLCQSLAGVPDTPYVRDLLVATCAIETQMGVYLHQTGRGPALSIYQIEPTSLEDLLKNFASQKRYAPLLAAVRVPAVSAEDEIMFNLRFATVCARLFYYRVKEPLPKLATFDNLWHYYKTYWNTEAGAATSASFRSALKLTDIRV
jgi:hypothetical protein